ncbi:MAG: hypothetical protein CMH27_09800 [Micavibrio sp.]|nr:hypothetical protein [Micavibrio sp.]|tara:strand:+ start:2403 stop:2774 length:372 start_codon:yes stop_codon:yes gene_type:complete
MFDPDIQKTNGSLILNKNNEVAFVYSVDLPFVPQWVSMDIDLGEIFIGAPEDDDHDGQGFKLDRIDKTIYDRVMTEKRLLLICVEGGDIRNAKSAQWVPLMTAHQDASPPEEPPTRPKSSRYK